MRRFKLTVAYDGTDYCGWQVQPNGITVEGVLNRALSELTGEKIAVIGASRTDSGVHARGNVAVFDSDTTIPGERIAYALNQRLPEDVVAVRSEEVPTDWHPRYQDTVKTYEYHILNSEMPDPLRRRDTYFVSYPLDTGKMQEAAEYLKGEHDFKSFCNIHTDVEDTVRTIYELDVVREGSLITIRITGNGFLYNMPPQCSAPAVYGARRPDPQASQEDARKSFCYFFHPQSKDDVYRILFRSASSLSVSN